MEQVRIDFLVTANTSSMHGQIAALNKELLATAANTAALGKSLSSIDTAAATRQFSQMLTASGQFTAQTVTMRNSTMDLADTMMRGKLTTGQYFSEMRKHIMGQRGLVSELARQQVQLRNSIVTPLGTTPDGRMNASVITPTGIPRDAGSMLQVANKRWEVFNALAQRGATHMVNMGKNTQWAGRQLMVGFTVPLMMVGGLAAKTFMEMDKELVRLQKVYGSGFTFGEDFKAQSEVVREEGMKMAKELAAAYGQAGQETIGLMAELAATGFEGEELNKMTEQTTKLSVLGEIEKQEAMKATVALQSAFKMSTDQVADSVLFLNAVENQTSATLQDLVEAIPRAGTVIEGLGGSVEDLALYMVAMREGGISAAEGANALKSGLSSIIAPPAAASEFLKNLGINLPKIVEENAGELTPTLLAFQKQLMTLDDLSRQQAITKLFGKYQFARMNAFFNNLGAQGSQTQQVFDLMKKDVTELKKLADQEIGAIAESVSGKWAQSWETFKISIAGVGETLLKWGTKALDVLNSVFAYIDDSPILKSFLKGLGILSAAIGPIIMIIGLFGNMLGMIFKGILRLSNGFKVLTSSGPNKIARSFEILTADTLELTHGLGAVEKEMYDHAKASEVVQRAAMEWKQAIDGVTAATEQAAAATRELTAAQMAGGKVPPITSATDRGYYRDSLYQATGQKFQYAHRTPENLSPADRANVERWLTEMDPKRYGPGSLEGRQVHYGPFSASYQSSEANARAGDFLPYFAATGKDAKIATPAGLNMDQVRAAGMDPEAYIADVNATFEQLKVSNKEIIAWNEKYATQIRELAATGATLEESQKLLVQANYAADRAAVASGAIREHDPTLSKGKSGSITKYTDLAEQRILASGGLYGSTAAIDQQHIRDLGMALDKAEADTKNLSAAEVKAAASIDAARATYDRLNKTNVELSNAVVGSKAALTKWATALTAESAQYTKDDVAFQQMVVAEQKYAVALNKQTGEVLAVRGYNAAGALGKPVDLNDEVNAELKMAAEQFGDIIGRSAQEAGEILEQSAREAGKISEKAAVEEGRQEIGDSIKEGQQENNDAIREGLQEVGDSVKEGAVEIDSGVTESRIEQSGGRGGMIMGGKGTAAIGMLGMATMMLPMGGAGGAATNTLGMAATGAMMGSMVTPIAGTIVGAIAGGLIGATPTIYNALTRASKEAAEQFQADWEAAASVLGDTLSQEIGDAFNVKNWKVDLYQDMRSLPSSMMEELATSSEKFAQKVAETFPEEINALGEASAEATANSAIILYNKLLVSGMDPEKAQKIIQSMLEQANKKEYVLEVTVEITKIKNKADAKDSLRDTLGESVDNLYGQQLDDYGFGIFRESHREESRKRASALGETIGEYLESGITSKTSPDEVIEMYWDEMERAAEEISSKKNLDWQDAIPSTLMAEYNLSGNMNEDLRTIWTEWDPDQRKAFYDDMMRLSTSSDKFAEFWEDFRTVGSSAAYVLGNDLPDGFDQTFAAATRGESAVGALNSTLLQMQTNLTDIERIASTVADTLPGAFMALIPQPSVTQDDVTDLIEEQEKALAAEERQAERAKEAIEEQQEAIQDQIDALDKRAAAYERDIEKIEKYYDKEIAQIERAEEKKQEAFDREEERFQKRQEMRNLEISYQEAIANGELYEAARIRMDIAAIKKQREQEDAREKSAEKAEARIKRLDQKRKEELRPIKEKLKALRQESRQLERQSEMLDERAEQIDENLEDFKDAQKSELKALKERVDEEAREYQNLADRIQKIWDKSNLSMQQKMKRTLEIVGKSNSDQAKAFVKVWEEAFGDVGKKAAGSIKDSIKDGDWASVTTALVGSLGLDKSTANLLENWMTNPPSIRQTDSGWAFAKPGGKARPRNHAAGGYISGPGTGTSDSIPARLSNGEYVVRAASVKKYGKGLLDGINAGVIPNVQTFAQGGIVEAMTQGLAAKSAASLASQAIPLSMIASLLNAKKTPTSGMFAPGAAGTYSGTSFSAEQLRNAAIIVSVGKRMGASHRDLIIGLMTAMQESTLHNYKSAVDHDSLGLFQQRPSMGWGTPKQITNPKYASKKFFQRLLAIEDRDKLSLTEAAQRVQVSAYPDAYAKWEDEARAVLAGMSRGGGGYVKPWIGTHPVGRTFSEHGRTGVDIPMPVGTPLRAATSGRLTNHPFAFGSYGNWYMLDANGFGFVYAHLDKDKASSGMIKAGQIIGYSGNTGNSFGPHLHFEARKGGSFSNQTDPHSLGIPGLRKGGKINYDNTVANLHRGETVLTSTLTKRFEDNIANAGGNEYNFDVTIENLSSDVDLERAFERFVVKHENRQAARNGRGRRV